MCKQVVELDCETFSTCTVNVQVNSEQINNSSIKYLLFHKNKKNNEVTRLLQASLVFLQIFLSVSINSTLITHVSVHKRNVQVSYDSYSSNTVYITIRC